MTLTKGFGVLAKLPVRSASVTVLPNAALLRIKLLISLLDLAGGLNLRSCFTSATVIVDTAVSCGKPTLIVLTRTVCTADVSK